mmetsp:Transcript_7167/g.12033  ORF Transcript_7167/g.12033 Transcript_7167/m.12033 type:complete len:119 (+) Transcript_7167:3642-3998(+)
MPLPEGSLRRGISFFPRSKENIATLQELLDLFDSSNWSVKAFRMLGEDHISMFQLSRFPPLQIAQQASLMQHFLHQQIGEDEILSLKYSDEGLCPNLCVLRKWNDNVSFRLSHYVTSG